MGPTFHHGGWNDANDKLTVRDPESGDWLAEVGSMSAGEVGDAVDDIAACLADGPDWPVWQRRQTLADASDMVAAREHELVEVIVRESSKTIREATREVRRVQETLRLTSEQADRLCGETLPLAQTPRGGDRLGWFTREPVGIVAAITPFNDPMNLVVHKIAPALMAGNGVALKPAESTPLSALAIAEILLECGVPGRRIAVLPGTGEIAGAALASHPRVDLVSFTGGRLTGEEVARAAGAKKTLMELGGNCAVVVLNDADCASAALAVVDGAFGGAGQNCVSVQRVFVARQVYESFLDEVVRLTRTLTVGSKRDWGTDVGPMINEAAASRVEDWVDEALSRGAKVLIGHERKGTFYAPTVLTGVPSTARLMLEEVFGPVVIIEPVESVQEAVGRVNETDYGLQAGVFTADIDLALRIGDQLRVGGVLINDTSDFRIDAMPFGGPKRSGIGREGVRYSIEAMTEPKITIINRRRPDSGLSADA
jgi:acyl-CoA reductase-like NAD-dependent aldehyde dehydrogenase